MILDALFDHRQTRFFQTNSQDYVATFKSGMLVAVDSSFEHNPRVNKQAGVPANICTCYNKINLLDQRSLAVCRYWFSV